MATRIDDCSSAARAPETRDRRTELSAGASRRSDQRTSTHGGCDMKKPPAYQHYARDWLVDTASISLEEQGAYQRLLDHEWIEGPLPDNPTELARRLAVPRTRFAKLWESIYRFFEKGEDGLLRDPRLELERAEQEERRRRNAESGRRGAATRWHGDRHADSHGERHSTRHCDRDGAAMTLQSASASASADSQLHDRAARRVGTSGSNGDQNPSFDELMELVRQNLYIPDGKPPAGWDEIRERSILEVLVKRHGARDVAIAIEGVACLRNEPAISRNKVGWLRPGEKSTLRVLYNSRSGLLPMFSVASQAYWNHQNREDHRKQEPVRVGEILSTAAASLGSSGR